MAWNCARVMPRNSFCVSTRGFFVSVTFAILTQFHLTINQCVDTLLPSALVTRSLVELEGIEPSRVSFGDRSARTCQPQVPTLKENQRPRLKRGLFCFYPSVLVVNSSIVRKTKNPLKSGQNAPHFGGSLWMLNCSFAPILRRENYTARGACKSTFLMFIDDVRRKSFRGILWIAILEPSFHCDGASDTIDAHDNLHPAISAPAIRWRELHTDTAVDQPKCRIFDRTHAQDGSIGISIVSILSNPNPHSEILAVIVMLSSTGLRPSRSHISDSSRCTWSAAV